IPTAKTKEGKKFNGRLSKERKLAIWSLHEIGDSVQAISSKLWISEKVIKKFLEIPTKKADSIIVADNSKKGLDSFIDEVNDSK
ncbi:MAG: hypothetical protein ACYSW3_28505, partial [Planctomycetota bacterium]